MWLYGLAYWLGEEALFRLAPFMVAGVRGVVAGTVVWVALHVFTGDPLTVVAAVLVSPLLVYAYALYESPVKGFAVSAIVHAAYNISVPYFTSGVALYKIGAAAAVPALVFSAATDVISRDVLDEAAVLLVASGILGFIGLGATIRMAPLLASLTFAASFAAVYAWGRRHEVFGDGDLVHAAAGSVAAALLAPDTPLIFVSMAAGALAGLAVAVAAVLVQRGRGGYYAMYPFVATMNTMFIATILLPYVFGAG